MSYRIGIAGITHESNTFCSKTTSIEDFDIHQSDEIVADFRGTRTYVGGMLSGAQQEEMTVVPLFVAKAQPSGTIAKSAYDTMLHDMCERLKASMPLDGVVLALHGAGVAEGIDDLEEHLCRAVRDLIGPNVPIVVTLDLHGNLTQAMAETVQCMLGVHNYPHTDMYERGEEAVAILARILRGELNPVTHVTRLPMLLPLSPTEFEPAASVNRLCLEMESRAGVIDCTFFHGFPWADTPGVCASVVATTNGLPELARECADHVADTVWRKRSAFLEASRAAALTPEVAVRRALQFAVGPVVINETSDNPGGGAPGDGTHLLKAMLDAGVRDACFGFIWDPEVALQAHTSGAGREIHVRLGGKYDDLHGATLDLRAHVVGVTDGRFTLQTPMGRGHLVDLGKSARLQVKGIDIVVSSRRAQTLDPGPFLLHGIDVSRYRIVALKSSVHFRAGFAPIARAILTSDSEGLTSGRLETFPRHRLERAYWPIDLDCSR